MRAASAAPVASFCSITTAAPASASASAFFRWWSSVAVGSGIENRGFAGSHQFGQCRGPGTADHEVGLREPSRHVVEKRLDLRFESRRAISLFDHVDIAFACLDA
jgi:hypothetical protein